MYTGDPINNPLDRVRIYCTDTDNDEILIEDSILEFFLAEENGDEKKAAIKALGYLLFQIAKMGDEKVGGVYLKNSERTKNLKLLLDDLKGGLLKPSIPMAYGGGISVADTWTRRHDWDSIRKPTNTGDAFARDRGEAFYDQGNNPLFNGDNCNTAYPYQGDFLADSNVVVVEVEEKEDDNGQDGKETSEVTVSGISEITGSN